MVRRLLGTWRGILTPFDWRFQLHAEVALGRLDKELLDVQHAVSHPVVHRRLQVRHATLQVSHGLEAGCRLGPRFFPLDDRAAD